MSNNKNSNMFISNYDGGFYEKFPPAEIGATNEDFMYLLAWCSQNKAADITIQSGEPVWADINGKLSQVTKRPPTSTEIESFIRLVAGEAAISLLNSGKDLDPSYETTVRTEVRDSEGRILYTYSGTTEKQNEHDKPQVEQRRYRYRVNITAGRSDDSTTGFQLTFRAMPDTPASLKDLPGIEEPLLDMKLLRPANGLMLVTGPTGSGKSTFLYGVLRYLLESDAHHEKILDYSSPIEYVLDEVKSTQSFIHQIPVGERNKGLYDPDNKSERAAWAYAVRNALRRKPTIINIGESRDAATFSGCLQAAYSGHMTYTTLHTIGVPETIRRALGFYTLEERRGVGLDLLQALRFVITQQLVPRKDGKGKVAIREFIYFNDVIVDMLSAHEPEDWPIILVKIMDLDPEIRKKEGVISQTFKETTTRLLEEGIISEKTYNDYRRIRRTKSSLSDMIND